MSLSLKQSREIYDFKPILAGFVSDFGYVYWPAILEWCRLLASPDDRLFWQVWLVIENDSVIGICGLYSLADGADELWLGWFGILPQLRNSGRGSEALKLIESEAVKRGCKTLRTYVDKEGKPIPFYVRHGFVRISSVGEFCNQTGRGLEHFESSDDHVMEKHLQIESE